MSDINTYANEEAITALSNPINGDLVLNQDNNSLYLCTDAELAGLARWKKFADEAEAAAFLNRWGASFDGSDDCLSVTQNSAINISGDITLSAWVKRTKTNSYNAIFTKRLVGGSMNYQFTINNLNGQLGLGHSGGAWVYNTTTTLSINTWYHVAVTVSGGTAQFYIDGVAKDSFEGITITSTTHNLIIGATFGYNYFGGSIDEAALWDCALSAPDITKIYSNGNPTDLTLAGSYDTDRTANLKGYWRMGDDSNDSPSAAGNITGITDSSGNENHATTVANSQPTFSALTSSETIYA